MAVFLQQAVSVAPAFINTIKEQPAVKRMEAAFMFNRSEINE
jgi:hypothetical protein